MAHGTRSAAGVAATEALVARVRALRPELRVERCYLDLVEPSLPDALARLAAGTDSAGESGSAGSAGGVGEAGGAGGMSGGTSEVVVVPLLLGAGYHVRVDIPRALAAAPRPRARTARALGPHPLLAEALADRLAEAGRRPGDGPVVLAAAGSTDPAANAGAAAMASMLRDRLPGRPEVVPAYLGAAGPTVAEAVAALRARGHVRVGVAAYLLGPGFFAARAVGAGAVVTSAPFGPHDAVARLVALRYDEVCGAARRPVPAAGAGAAGR
ncbi:sirohydrochlorin chelatase [Actinacidiphila yeochonensis]|uniref:sirohydrochlorin chelatase n=1 Tax=Actinacidiphila yeochonensis TaxID=89050 RepID=UPI0018E34234|nr:CbiX/SirB N-terminal domain-containing protein [Actinacidiphila yeochonensis]